MPRWNKQISRVKTKWKMCTTRYPSYHVYIEVRSFLAIRILIPRILNFVVYIAHEAAIFLNPQKHNFYRRKKKLDRSFFAQ